ncbi:MAG: hypothetical protein ABSG64_08530 [Solirubrobacteraceae bacterium]|jgi:hypothetical protein
MPLVALGVTALLAGLDWVAWDWATTTGHDTVGLIAGLLMVPIVVAFAGVLAVALAGLARVGARRAAGWHREHAEQIDQRRAPSPPRGDESPSSTVNESRGRIAV